MQKKRMLMIIVLVLLLIVLVVILKAVYIRFIKTYKVGKEPTLSEITRAYCMTSMYSSDYGYIYDKYTVNTRDKKYYAETDIFDKENNTQVVTTTEITNAEYIAILRLIEGSDYVRQGKSDPNRMDGYMDSSNNYADIMWPHRPDGAWELSMDSGIRQEFVGAVKNAVQTITISFIDDIEPSSVWIIRDTPDNRKTSIWGTAMIMPMELGTEYSSSIPLSEDNKYLFRMIDENGIYYEADIPELLDGWKIKAYRDGSDMGIFLEIIDNAGNIKYKCDVFNAAL